MGEFRFSRITCNITPGFGRLPSAVKGMLECMLGGLRQSAVVFGLTPPLACEYCETARCTEIDFRITHSLSQGWSLALTEKPRKSLLWETKHPFVDMLTWFVNH